MRLSPVFTLKNALLLALLAGLLGCGKTPGPVRLDFVGAPNLTSSDRTVAAADTISVRLFAKSSDARQPLTNLRITVTATPLRRPFVYPTVLSSFRPQNLPAPPPQILLDSVFSKTEIVLRTVLTARATTGSERWEFTASDAAGNTARRAFRLVVRRPDSLALVQTYTLLARPGRDIKARPYLVLDSGQLLPYYAARPALNLVRNQQTIDLVAIEAPVGLRLASPNAPATVPLPARWPNPRATLLRRTTISVADFAKPVTPAEFEAAYTNGTAFTLDGNASTDALAKDQVVAFQTPAGPSGARRFGLLLVADLSRTPAPLLKVNVRMAK